MSESYKSFFEQTFVMAVFLRQIIKCVVLGKEMTKKVLCCLDLAK